MTSPGKALSALHTLNSRLKTIGRDSRRLDPYDLFGDGSLLCVAIPGHADGLCAVKVTGADGRFALLFSDGGYSSRSWREMAVSGIANDRARQRASLAWIREQSLDPRCVESLANHDPDVRPHVIEL